MKASTSRPTDKNIPSIKNDGLVVIRQYSMHQVQAHGPCQNELFQIAAFADEVLHGITMADPDDFLFDDRTIVQFRSHVMTGSADQLNAAPVGLVVRLGAHEGREKGVMNIDDAIGKFGNEGVAQNLHISGQDNQLNSTRA